MAGQSAYQITESLFLRLLGLIYLSAFGSLWPQIVGLIGSHGIAPVGQAMTNYHAESGARAFWYMPTLFWFGVSDAALVWCCVLGCLASLVLISGWFRRWSAGVCWVLYLSLVSVGEPFTGFQWDALLLEAGFLALFAGVPWLVWAYRFLLFRLMFESGVVKLSSGDPNWRNFHALRFHFVTQPLPNPLAYYMNAAPVWMLDSMTCLTLAIELFAPFLLFGPRKIRQIGGALLIALQLIISFTGNYAFFNLLTIALCLWAFDDETLTPLGRFFRRTATPVQSRYLRTALQSMPALLMALGGLQLLQMGMPRLRRPLAFVAPWELVNSYGLFAVMTTKRPEIVLEGSNDLTAWREYSFPYKPGELHRGLPFAAPHQPRLDWQMWFAALGEYAENGWVGGLLMRILEGEPSVLKLMGPAPFTSPPKYVRALLYDYQFTTADERARTGAVWKRRLMRVWFGPVSLRAK